MAPVRGNFARAVGDCLQCLVLRSLVGQPLHFVRELLCELAKPVSHRLVDELDDVSVKQWMLLSYETHGLSVVAVETKGDLYAR